jgi:hypothetical protein
MFVISPVTALKEVSGPAIVWPSLSLPPVSLCTFKLFAELLSLRLEGRKDIKQVRLLGLWRNKVFKRILTSKPTFQ